jgi:hypothetical protein
MLIEGHKNLDYNYYRTWEKIQPSNHAIEVLATAGTVAARMYHVSDAPLGQILSPCEDESEIQHS